MKNLSTKILLICVATIVLIGCRSVRTVVETHTSDSTRIANYWKSYYRNQMDSIYHGHAVITDRTGDTIRIIERDTFIEYRDIVERDTIYRGDTIETHTVDSIPQLIEVEKPLTPKEQFLIKTGEASLYIWAAVIIGLIIGIYFKFKR